MRVAVSKIEKNARKLKAIEKELRSKEKLLYTPEVKILLKAANETFSNRIFKSATDQLRNILDCDNADDIRKPDSFLYGPPQLIDQGTLHLLDQMDGVKFSVDPAKLVTGMLILGPQGAGKSRFFRNLYYQISQNNPDVKFLLIDPKNEFSDLSGSRHLDLSKLSFDLSAPSGIDQERFISEFMPILADSTSVIFGLTYYTRAVDVALSQLHQHGGDTNLCLKDIYEAILTFNPKSFREQGYRDSSKTGLSQMLGSSDLFSCRKGLPLSWLFQENTVLMSRCLTSELQCRGILIFLLYWVYQKYRDSPKTKKLRHVIFVDDATRFVGSPNNYQSEKRTSPLGHILAVLRSAGVAVVFASQIPGQIDPAVLALSRNLAVVGNITGNANLRVIRGCMSLDYDQEGSILGFKRREALVFVSDSPWPRPVHGWVPFVPDERGGDVEFTDCSDMIVPWHSLTEVSQSETPKPIKQVSNVNTALDKLLLDCIHYPYSKVREHIDRTKMSVRGYETTMNSALQDGYLLHSTSGKSVFLIPTKKAFEKFGMPNPYERCASVEHSFYVGLAVHLLKQYPGMKVKPETPIGQKGAAIDATFINSKGEMVAIELTLSLDNLMSNASKLLDTSYKKIIWLTKDAATAKAVRAYFNKITSLPNEFIDKFEYVHFSSFAKSIKKGLL
jgi:hypothetical protein